MCPSLGSYPSSFYKPRVCNIVCLLKTRLYPQDQFLGCFHGSSQTHIGQSCPMSLFLEKVKHSIIVPSGLSSQCKQASWGWHIVTSAFCV